MARARSDKSLARFDRIALVLSGGGALGAYQAGAYAALENGGVRPNWIAGTAIGAINAAIIAGNLPHERTFRLRQFWQELSRRVAIARRGRVQPTAAARDRAMRRPAGAGADIAGGGDRSLGDPGRRAARAVAATSSISTGSIPARCGSCSARSTW